jgi:hypothetical protein
LFWSEPFCSLFYYWMQKEEQTLLHGVRVMMTGRRTAAFTPISSALPQSVVLEVIANPIRRSHLVATGVDYSLC